MRTSWTTSSVTMRIYGWWIRPVCDYGPCVHTLSLLKPSATASIPLSQPLKATLLEIQGRHAADSDLRLGQQKVIIQFGAYVLGLGCSSARALINSWLPTVDGMDSGLGQWICQ